ncbi:MAG: tetratricopeptide repeat protein, partial [Pseudomonadota bacterium]|nr:tetratricopeptide repeat protein [Pseudomonadota bacterium]
MAKMVYATALGKVAEFTTSFEIFESLQSDYPQNTDVAYNYGLLLKEAERFDDAQKQLSKAIAINPNYHVAFHALGNLMSELGRNEEAQLAYEKAIAKNPKNIQ